MNKHSHTLFGLDPVAAPLQSTGFTLGTSRIMGANSPNHEFMSKTISALKKQPSQKRAQQRLQLILASTSELLGRDGLAGLTMPKLAKEAGISVGSLYQYFANKQSVLTALYEQYLANLRKLMNEFLLDIDNYPDWREGIEFLLKQLLQAEQDSGPLAEINQALQLYPELCEIDEQHSKEVSRMLAAVLKHYQFPGTKAQLDQLVYFSYSINIGTWSYRSRFASRKQLEQCNRWELVANIAVLEDYLNSFK